MHIQDPARRGGFSLVELLVATTVVLLVLAAVLALTDSLRASSLVQVESGDVEQRLRVASHSLGFDLEMAGAGAYGGSHAMPLTSVMAPLLPYRVGRLGAHAPGTYTSDVVTVFYVPKTASQTTTSSVISPGQLVLHVSGEGCPPSLNLCGITAGATILLHDADGHFDTFSVQTVTTGEGRLIANSPGGALQTTYGVGSKVAEVVQRTYALKPGSDPEAHQLVSYDGSGSSDVPVVDHVVGLTFSYYGDPRPPQTWIPTSEPATERTTYGPRPPAADSQPTLFPPGENCAFSWALDAGVHSPRLLTFGGGGSSRTLVRLGAVEFADGNAWCPDAAAAHAFDADLLRIRKVGVTLRVESAVDALRGPAGPLFARSGTATNARRLLPDREIRFQITPPNLNLRP